MHHHHHHISVRELGHLLTRSVYLVPLISLVVIQVNIRPQVFEVFLVVVFDSVGACRCLWLLIARTHFVRSHCCSVTAEYKQYQMRT